MIQKTLTFKYLEEKKSKKITGMAGLLPILELVSRTGLFKFAEHNLGVKQSQQGWRDGHMLLSCLLINLSGGDCVSDIEHLESDSGLTEVLKHCEHQLLGLSRRQIASCFRKERHRVLPSECSLHRYFENFHNDSSFNRELALSNGEKAFIPPMNRNLKKLKKFYKYQSLFMQKNNPVESATLEVDAVVCASEKQNAFYSYKGCKGYQPLNGYWHEQNILVNSQFRDGNVNSNAKVLDFVKESFKNIPKEIKKRYFRMDTAGYLYDVMNYCEDNGIIFSVSAPMCNSLKKDILKLNDSQWKNVEFTSDQIVKRSSKLTEDDESLWQWQEVDHIPDDKRYRDYRYIVIRSIVPEQKELIDTGREAEDENQQSGKFYKKDGTRYRLRVIVTNNKLTDGCELFHWHNKRCGYSEQAHSLMKKDFAGSHFPSNKFGSNAFWWGMMLISLNTMNMYKQLVLGKAWVKRRMKAVRFHFIYIAGRIQIKGRCLIVNIVNSKFFNECREKVHKLALTPI